MLQQKRLRKAVALTEAQSRKLHQLSEFGGPDPLEHTLRAINEYLRKQNFNLSLAGESEILTRFKSLTG